MTEIKNIKGIELLPRRQIILPEPYETVGNPRNHHDGIVYNTGIVWDVDDFEIEIVKLRPSQGADWDIILSQEDSTDDSTIYGIHSGGITNGISGSVAGITLTSSFDRANPEDGNGFFYINFTAKNGLATLTVRRTYTNTTDVKTANYTFVPATQPICVFGTIINDAVSSFCHWDNYLYQFKIKKAGVLVLDAIFVKEKSPSQDSNIKIFNFVDNSVIDPTVGRMLYVSSVGYFDSTFQSKKNITSVDLAETSWQDNSMWYAFASCNNLQTVTNIPNTVTDLRVAFRLTNISSINIPNSVTDLGATFTYCYNLVTAPVIPSAVTYLDETFSGCSNLVNAPIIPNSVTTMYMTFSSCTNLVNAPTIPNSVTNMQGTFWGCSNLVNAPTIPDSVMDLITTFSYCNNLVNAPVIPNSVTNMTSTFRNCISLTNVPAIPNSVTDMHGTFEGCSNLVNAPVIPNSVTKMTWTFANCSSLVNVPTISNSVTDMTSTFRNCISLTNAPVISESAFTEDYITMTNTFDSCTNLTGNIYIHSSRVSNAANCFANTTLTKNVYIPFNTVTHSSFNTAGYDENGNKDNVYLKDINSL